MGDSDSNSKPIEVKHDLLESGESVSDKLPCLPPNDAPYCGEKMHLVKVLLNDVHSKCVFLHTKFTDFPDDDAIVILQKSAFSIDEITAWDAQCKRNNVEGTGDNPSEFPPWNASDVTHNDIYHRFVVNSGLEKLNSVNMTVIHPAGANHFAKYTASKRHIVFETAEMYNTIIVPFLVKNPKDLSWVSNVLEGKAEGERILFSNLNKVSGFIVALDFRWDGSQLSELHCLGLTESIGLTCLRDLNSSHIPMLKEMLKEGRRSLVEKYGSGISEKNQEGLREDQIIAYFHYPPTFYRLHMHFIHVDGAADGGTQTGKAHLAEDVISNLELKSDFYSSRTMPIYLYENHPFFAAINSTE